MPINEIIINDLSNSEVIYRNFSGIPGNYNEKGDRKFTIRVPEDMVEELISDGWYVKEYLPDKRDPDTVWHTINVTLDFNPPYEKHKPHVYEYMNGVKREVFEDTICTFDEDTFDRVGIKVRAYDWGTKRHGTRKVSGYVKEIHAVLSNSVASLANDFDQYIKSDPDNDLPFDL